MPERLMREVLRASGWRARFVVYEIVAKLFEGSVKPGVAPARSGAARLPGVSAAATLQLRRAAEEKVAARKEERLLRRRRRNGGGGGGAEDGGGTGGGGVGDDDDDEEEDDEDDFDLDTARALIAAEVPLMEVCVCVCARVCVCVCAFAGSWTCAGVCSSDNISCPAGGRTAPYRGG